MYRRINTRTRRQGLLPAAVRLLYVDQIVIDDFCCCFLCCIHPLYPFHLVGCFERFRDTFYFGKFFYQPKEHILRLLVQLGEVTGELSTENQTVVQPFAIFTVILKMPTVSPVGSVGASAYGRGVHRTPAPPYADGLMFFLWECQARNVVIALQLVPKVVVFITKYLKSSV